MVWVNLCLCMNGCHGWTWLTWMLCNLSNEINDIVWYGCWLYCDDNIGYLLWCWDMEYLYDIDDVNYLLCDNVDYQLWFKLSICVYIDNVIEMF